MSTYKAIIKQPYLELDFSLNKMQFIAVPNQFYLIYENKKNGFYSENAHTYPPIQGMYTLYFSSNKCKFNSSLYLIADIC